MDIHLQSVLVDIRLEVLLEALDDRALVMVVVGEVGASIQNIAFFSTKICKSNNILLLSHET